MSVRMAVPGDWVIAEITLHKQGEKKTDLRPIVGYAYRLVKVSSVDNISGKVLRVQSARYYGRTNFYSGKSQAEVDTPSNSWALPSEFSNLFERYSKIHGGQSERPEWDNYDDALKALLDYVKLMAD